MKNKNVHFPNLILSDTYICEDVEMGQGCIISMEARISTNVKFGEFVFLSTGAKISHDGNIGSYVTLSPDVKLTGTVTIGNESEVGILRWRKMMKDIVVIGTGGFAKEVVWLIEENNKISHEWNILGSYK